MRLRLTLALCLFQLAGCQSSEPQNASYAAQPSLQAAPLAAPASLAGDATPAGSPLPAAPATASMSASPAGPSALPAYDSSIPEADATIAAEPPAAVPPGATNCSTVDGVTLCDAPADPGTDQSSVDAYNADEKLYTN